MATLYNTKISATYEGLLKTIDNAAISATLKELTDGSGNQSGLYLNTAGDFKVTSILEWGSLKDTGTGVTITQFVTAANGIENFDNDTTLPTSAAVKLYVDTKFSTTDTLTEVLGFGNTTSGKDIAISAGDDITFTDTSKILMGASSDLQIYHDGSNSVIKDSGIGNLYVYSDQFIINNFPDTQNMARFVSGGGVTLYYAGSTKIETTLLGATVTGDLLVTGTITGAGGSFLPLAGGTMTGDIILNDNVKSIYGTSSDFEMFHNSTTNSNILQSNLSRQLSLRQDNFVVLNQAASEPMITAVTNGAVSLYYDNSKKFETTSTGISWSGDAVNSTNGNLIMGGGQTKFNDSGRLFMGDSNDLQIYHDGSNSYIKDTGTGNLDILADSLSLQNAAGSEYYARFYTNGAAYLYNNGVARINTSGIGATVTGNLEVTGTITGAGGSFLPLIGGTMTGNTIHNDNVKSIYGTSSDLEIYHDGTHSYIQDTSGTGDLRIDTSAFRLRSANGGESMITAFQDSSVNLMFNTFTKLSTTNTGIAVTGNVVADGLDLANNEKIRLGSTNQGLQIFHDGNDSRIVNGVGGLYIDQSAVTQSIVFRTSNANALDTTALIINREGDLITGADVTIAGNLTVNGTTTTVNSQTLSVEDPLISLATANAANSLDIGFYGKYNDGTTRYTGLFNDASDSNKFKLFKGTTVEPTTTVNISGAGYVAADLIVAGLEATTGTFSGDVILSKTGAGTSKVSFVSDAVEKSYIELDASEDMIYYAYSGIKQVFYSNAQTTLTLDTRNATFAGDLAVNGTNITVANASNPYLYLNDTNGGTAIFQQSGNDTRIGSDSNTQVQIVQNNAVAVTIDTSKNATFAGDLFPASTGASDLGSDAKRFGNIFANGASIPYLTSTDIQLQGDLKVLNKAQSAYIPFATKNTTGSEVVMDLTNAGSATFAGNISSSGTLQLVGNTGSGFLSTFENISTSASAYSGFRIKNSDGGFAEFWRNSTTKSGTGNAALSLNIYNSADVNLWSGGTHTIALVGNNVGIGTTSPSEKLAVSGNSNITGKLAVGSSAAHPSYDFYNQGTSYFNGNTTVDDDLIVNGNVGIGTITPFSKLHVKTSTDHNFEFEETGGELRMSVLNDARSANIPLQFAASKFNFLSGNVGIGTTTPSEKLEVDGIIKAVHTDSTYAKLRGNGLFFNRSNTYIAPEADNFSTLGIGLSATRWGSVEINAATVKFQNGATETMRIDSSGNVGIGTSTPSTKLTVSGTQELLQLTRGGGSDTKWFFSADSTRLFIAEGTSDTANVKLAINKNGNVGIGTSTPTAPLQVVGMGEHTDNAAAITAGLTAGAFYRTGDLLKVVH